MLPSSQGEQTVGHAPLTEPFALERAKAVVADYVQLTKPGITMLVLVTTGIGYFVGSPAGLDPWHFLITLTGTLLLVMGGSCMNQVLEAEVDGRMRRTADRPIPAGRVSLAAGTFFGMGLSVAGALVLGILVNVPAFLVGLVSWVCYVLIYTLLKPVTSIATIVGAVPGALPPMIGYAAATGQLAMAGWLLFFILFFWQFPHFLAIGWMYREDYRRGGLKPLAVFDPTGQMSSRQILIYTISLLPVSLLPTAYGVTGPIYALAALGLGAYFIYHAARCRPERLDRQARPLFFASIVYLPVLLTFMVIDRFFH